MAIELHGLFIEDDELQRAAALPFAKELCRLTLSVREIQNTRFDRTIALRMRTARSAIEELARRIGVPHTFRNTQGSTVGLLRDTVQSADITFFEPLRKMAVPAARQYAPGHRFPRRIVVVIADLQTGKETLFTAARLAKNQVHNILILLRNSNTAKLHALEQMANELLPTHRPRLLLLPEPGVQHLISTVLAERADMLVIGAQEELLKPQSLGLLLQQLECPICLVRQSDRDVNEPVS